MKLLRKKKGMHSTVIIIFIAVIVFIAIAVFGTKSLNYVSWRFCSTELIQFKTDLKESIGAISSQTGTVEGKQYSVPCKIEKIYFIDLNEELDEDMLEESREISDSHADKAEKNVFFIKDEKVKEAIYVPELTLKYPFYRCFEMRKRPRIDMFLEGYNGGTNVVNRDDSANCGYITVEMMNETVNDEVIEGKDTADATQAAQAKSAILGSLTEEQAKERIEKTKKNVFIGRKVDIKKDGTEIKIRIKPNEGKAANEMVYVESIPKSCISLLSDYLTVESQENILANVGANINLFDDPVIVWNFGNEQITDKKEIEYELTSPEDCMRIINSLGFGEIS